MDVEILKKIARDAIRLDTTSYKPCRVLTVAHDNDRSFLHHGKYYSPLVDTIEDSLRQRGLECQSIARIISTVKGERAYGDVVSPEGAFARALLGKRAKALVLRGRYAYSHAEERIWADILDRTGAQKVLAIMPSRELCVACHRRGVWVADVQHGVIAESHPWYGASFRATDPRDWLPDAFLCWDKGSADVIDAWAAAQGVRTIVYGNRWISRFLRQAPDDVLVQKVRSQYRAELAALVAKPTILVSLSWGNYNIPNGFMVDDLTAIIQETSARYNWLLRLHPNQLVGFATDDGRRFTAYYDRELRDHAPWEWPTRAPLPLVLSAADLHVSWNSSVSIEAAQMGIRSGLTDRNLRDPAKRGDYYSFYRAANMIDFVDEQKAPTLAWIERNIGSRAGPESFDDYDRAYADLVDFLAA